MNLLHVINLDTIGGVEELFVHFLTYIGSHHDVQHHLLITGKPIHNHFLERIVKYSSKITYEKYILGIKLPKFLRKLKRRWVFRENFSKVVLWNRLFEDIGNLAGRAQIVYYEHGASWMHPKDESMQEFFKNVDTILVNSQAAEHIVRLKWAIDKPIFVIENPLRPDLDYAPRARSYASKPFKIGFIGRLIPLKGCSLLLHAVAILKRRGIEVELFIAGSGQEKEHLMQESVKLGIDSRVTFLGTVKDVTSFYDSVDLLVIPSIREPLGLVAIEAAARACPVIASFVDGLAEAVQEGGITLTPSIPVSEYGKFGGKLTGLPDLVFEPHSKTLASPKILNPEDLAKCIEELILDTAKYAQLSQAALNFAKEYQNFSNYAEKLLTFIS